jgi:hypothetical protein
MYTYYCKFNVSFVYIYISLHDRLKYMYTTCSRAFYRNPISFAISTSEYRKMCQIYIMVFISVQ